MADEQGNVARAIAAATRCGHSMSPQQIVGVFVRIFAIWLVFLAFKTVGLGLAINRDLIETHAREPYVLAFLFFVFSILLWRFAFFVANRLIPQGESLPHVVIDSMDIVSVALIVLGLWLGVAQALPLLIRYLTVLLVMIHRDIPMTSMDARSISLLCEGVVELLLASLFVLRARSFAANLLKHQL